MVVSVFLVFNVMLVGCAKHVSVEANRIKMEVVK
jgi:hypothetical protein